ncbi:MAG: cysteine desulfurase family protein [Patescibacteria group bacterium]
MSFVNNFFKQKRVFLDYASITPVRTEVVLAMQNTSQESFANPSALYTEAIVSKKILDESRKKIADILGGDKKNIVFTSGGTESNNLALLGVFNAFKKDGFVPHFITTHVEHPAILEVCKEIERRGGEVTYLPVSEDGHVPVQSIRESIKENTVLVTIQYVNNEIGTIQSIKEIGRVVKEYRMENKKDFPYFHTDACQAVCYLPIHVLKQNIDLLSLDGIKMYGPRGVGVLYVSKIVNIKPVVFGGGQENSLRSGTENVPGIVGFATSLELVVSEMEKEQTRLLELRDYAITEIQKAFPESHLNGSKEKRVANNINFCFPGLDAEFAVIALDVAGVSCSYSSSCRTLKEDSSSYVIESLGRGDCASSSLRFTLGISSRKKDIDLLLKCLNKIIKNR